MDKCVAWFCSKLDPRWNCTIRDIHITHDTDTEELSELMNKIEEFKLLYGNPPSDLEMGHQIYAE